MYKNYKKLSEKQSANSIKTEKKLRKYRSQRPIVKNKVQTQSKLKKSCESIVCVGF